MADHFVTIQISKIKQRNDNYFAGSQEKFFCCYANSFYQPGAKSNHSNKIHCRPGSTSGEGDVWRTITTRVKKIGGVHDLFFVFKGEKELFNFDYWQFSAK